MKENTITVFDLEHNRHNLSSRSLKIISPQRDFIISVGKFTYALDWDEDTRITYRLLYKIIKHPWFYLQIYQTSCGDCDGYDYSGCDYSRCKEDCSHCGGREYVCNYGCFEYRNDYAFSINLFSDRYKNDIDQAMDLLNRIAISKSKTWKRIKEENNEFLSEIREAAYYAYLVENNNDYVNEYIQQYDSVVRLCEYRTADVSSSDIITITVNSKKYIFLRNEVTARTRRMLLFWKYIEIEVDGYDYQSDSIISISWDLKKEKQFGEVEELINNNKIKELNINSGDGELRITSYGY